MVNPLPTITVNSPTACTGSNLVLTASGGTVVSWVGPNAFSTAIQNPTITNAQPIHTGCYTVTGSSAQGCTNTAISCATVLAAPSISISSNSTVVCSGSTTTLTASGANSYSWSTGPIGNSLTVNPTSNNTYTVTGTDVNTCTNTAVKSISVNPLPNVSIVNSPSVLCTGQVATLTASGANTYTWNNSSNSNPILVSPGTTTVYTVNGTDANGCVNSYSITQTVSTCAGINENVSENNLFHLYPNPNNGEFYIYTKANMMLTITNVLGERTHIIMCNENELNKVQIDSLSSGIYFISGEYNNTMVKQKIVLTK